MNNLPSHAGLCKSILNVFWGWGWNRNGRKWAGYTRLCTREKMLLSIAMATLVLKDALVVGASFQGDCSLIGYNSPYACLLHNLSSLPSVYMPGVIMWPPGRQIYHFNWTTEVSKQSTEWHCHLWWNSLLIASELHQRWVWLCTIPSHSGQYHITMTLYKRQRYCLLQRQLAITQSITICCNLMEFCMATLCK